jgi:thioredoxin-related protein
MLASLFPRAAAIVAVLAAAMPVSPALSLELLMFERSGCPWCARWDKEVAPVYVLTPEGARAPLRRVNLDQGQPKNIVLNPPVRFTPTFVLVDGAREIGRITGYMNDATFWGLLTKMIPPSSEETASERRPLETGKVH